MNAAVSPRRIFAGETDRELADLRDDRRPARTDWWLGAMSGDEAAVPPDHGVWSHDQEHVGESAAVERSGEDREDRPVGFGEARSVDLALQDQDPVAEGQDLRVAFVSGGEEPTDPRHDESDESRYDEHRPTVRGSSRRPNETAPG